MNSALYRASLLVTFVLSCCATSQGLDGHHGHQHSDSDLDIVKCHNSVYKVSPTGGTPELVNGQESRDAPSRQYLPQQEPFKPREEVPAASYEQPSVLSVDKTFVSPSLQNNYRSLFGDKNKPDVLSPAAAQNVPSNVLTPAAPRVSSDKKHSHHDDEDNLERLCNDAFHSFLCKPIKGPRKTPTGRLRPNAVLPPDVLSGLSSIPDASRVRPGYESPSASNAVGQAYLPPQQQPSNVMPKSVAFTTTQKPRAMYLPPAPFVNILKEDKQESLVMPSPSNTEPQVVKLQPYTTTPNNVPTVPPHDCDKAKPSFQPILPSPTNDNPYILKPVTTSTPSPFKSSFYNKPTTSNPVKTFPQFPQPLRTIAPPHDCKNSQTKPTHFVANPSNDNPSVVKPYYSNTQKPLVSYNSKPFTSTPTYNPPAFFQTTARPHDCDKSSVKSSPEAYPSNDNPTVLKPFSTTTQKPFYFSTKPTVPYFAKNTFKFNTTPQVKPSQAAPHEDCEKHKLQPSQNPFSNVLSEVPQPTNNFAQVVAQPQQINSVAVSTKASSGYFYDKPSDVFPQPGGRPSATQTPTSTSGYRYDQPRLPFPSNNIPQVVYQPRTTVQPPTTPKPCDHDETPTADEGNPTNENAVVVKPNSGYYYDKPGTPFPPEKSGSSNQIPVSLRPSSTESSTGYYYDRPANPFLLPNPTNNFPNRVASPANSEYNYQTPDKSFPSTLRPLKTPSSQYQQPKAPFPTSINSKLEANDDSVLARAQTQVEVTARPGYSYDKPNSPILSPQATNQNSGYNYPKPSRQFSR